MYSKVKKNYKFLQKRDQKKLPYAKLKTSEQKKFNI